MVTVVNATDAKNRFGEMIKRAYIADEHLIIKRGGIPVVAIVPMSDYERLVSSDRLPSSIAKEVKKSAKQERARSNMRAFLEDVHGRMPDISEKKAAKEIAKEIREVRKGK